MAFLKATRSFSGQRVGYSLETRAEPYAQTESGVARVLMLGNPFPIEIVLGNSLVLWQKLSAPLCLADEPSEEELKLL